MCDAETPRETPTLPPCPRPGVAGKPFQPCSYARLTAGNQRIQMRSYDDDDDYRRPSGSPSSPAAGPAGLDSYMQEPARDRWEVLVRFALQSTRMGCMYRTGHVRYINTDFTVMYADSAAPGGVFGKPSFDSCGCCVGRPGSCSSRAFSESWHCLGDALSASTLFLRRGRSKPVVGNPGELSSSQLSDQHRFYRHQRCW